MLSVASGWVGHRTRSNYPLPTDTRVDKLLFCNLLKCQLGYKCFLQSIRINMIYFRINYIYYYYILYNQIGFIYKIFIFMFIYEIPQKRLCKSRIGISELTQTFLSCDIGNLMKVYTPISKINENKRTKKILY